MEDSSFYFELSNCALSLEERAILSLYGLTSPSPRTVGQTPTAGGESIGLPRRAIQKIAKYQPCPTVKTTSFLPIFTRFFYFVLSHFCIAVFSLFFLIPYFPSIFSYYLHPFPSNYPPQKKTHTRAHTTTTNRFPSFPLTARIFMLKSAGLQKRGFARVRVFIFRVIAARCAKKCSAKAVLFRIKEGISSLHLRRYDGNLLDCTP